MLIMVCSSVFSYSYYTFVFFLSYFFVFSCSAPCRRRLARFDVLLLLLLGLFVFAKLDGFVLISLTRCLDILISSFFLPAIVQVGSASSWRARWCTSTTSTRCETAFVYRCLIRGDVFTRPWQSISYPWVRILHGVRMGLGLLHHPPFSRPFFCAAVLIAVDVLKVEHQQASKPASPTRHEATRGGLEPAPSSAVCIYDMISMLSLLLVENLEHLYPSTT